MKMDAIMTKNHNCPNHQNHDICICIFCVHNSENMHLNYENRHNLRIIKAAKTMNIIIKVVQITNNHMTYICNPRWLSWVLCSQQWEYASKLWKSSQSQNHQNCKKHENNHQHFQNHVIRNQRWLSWVLCSQLLVSPLKAILEPVILMCELSSWLCWWW